jgi:hypothetical protein
MDDLSSRTTGREVPARPPAGAAGVPADPGGLAGTVRDESAVAIIRRSGQGWRVGEEEVPDLTSAIVLADLLMPGLQPPRAPGRADSPGMADGDGQDTTLAGEAARLRVTVAQLQHALATRVQVEQAIGVLCERRRLPPRRAFELLRGVARGGGLRLSDLAAQVVDSATNPLLILPGDLARPPQPQRPRGRSPRHRRAGD